MKKITIQAFIPVLISGFLIAAFLLLAKPCMAQTKPKRVFSLDIITTPAMVFIPFRSNLPNYLTQTNGKSELIGLNLEWTTQQSSYNTDFRYSFLPWGYGGDFRVELAERNLEALDFHFNASLTAVAIANALHWLNLPADKRGAFSMADIKTRYFNELMLERFFIAYGINPHHAKNHHANKSLSELGKIAA